MTIEDKISFIQHAILDDFGGREAVKPVIIINANLLGELTFNSPRIIVEQEKDNSLYWIFGKLRIQLIDSRHIAYGDILFFDIDKNGIIQLS